MGKGVCAFYLQGSFSVSSDKYVLEIGVAMIDKCLLT
jgi:hypothetical protein